MRDLIRQIVEGYKSLKLEAQKEDYVLFSGEEPDTRQPVWIKILPRVLGEDFRAAARFQELAQGIRQLNHPNIAAVRQVGEKAGVPYIVSRIVEKAQPLAARLDDQWSVDLVAELAMQAGRALEHAYNKGIAHGSLSPQNILVQDNGRVLVTDFGLSELLELGGGRLTKAISPYLAPERVSGHGAQASADVYSLAAIAYSLLTKRVPQVSQGRVLPPSRFNPDTPPAMDQIIIKALDPNPEDRYPDVKSFLTALGAVKLTPAVEEIQPAQEGERCPRCGARDQRGHFCRRCGARLREPEPDLLPEKRSRLDEPIQITQVDVGRVEVGSGVETHDTTIAHATSVATGELADQFPEALEMPKLDLGELWPTIDGQPLITMPEPIAMPTIDWAEIAPPMPAMPTLEDPYMAANEEDG